jgi:S-adenosylmethionine:tRNA ribosyltransferase-isomerase
MKTGDFDYHLPQELIAQTPMEPRDHSRLMVVSRTDGSIQHRRFYDLPEFLRSGDVLVFNDSRVFPARLYGRRDGSGGHVELLLLSRTSPGVWRALVRPGRRMRDGTTFVVGGDQDREEIRGEILQVEDDGTRLVRLSNEDAVPRLGVVPLPPYIHEPLADWERYQTVYSRVEGGVAVPTAGLHFTPALLDRVRSLGAETVFVTLHVGWDSFRPVKDEDPADHAMHSEYWELGREAADAINRAKVEGRRVVSVGTTAVRLLEQAAALAGKNDGSLAAGSGWADLYILPGYRFHVVDALVTNFHLPRSTLLMLTCALAGRDLILDAYREAAEQRYRFYSFGDGMFIL